LRTETVLRDAGFSLPPPVSAPLEPEYPARPSAGQRRPQALERLHAVHQSRQGPARRLVPPCWTARRATWPSRHDHQHRENDSCSESERAGDYPRGVRTPPTATQRRASPQVFMRRRPRGRDGGDDRKNCQARYDYSSPMLKGRPVPARHPYRHPDDSHAKHDGQKGPEN